VSSFASGPRPQSTGCGGPRASAGSRAWGTLATRSPHAGAVPAGSPVAEVEGDGQGEHQRGATDVLGKEGAGGAHQGRQSMARRSGGSVRRRAAGSYSEKGSVATSASSGSCEEVRER
jgi:hypothetical protein